MTDTAKQMFSARRASWRELCALEPAWRHLSDHAATPNIFLDPSFAIGAAEELGMAEALEAMLVWRGPESDGEIAAIMPFALRRRWRVPFPVVEVWAHAYAPACLPLVHSDCAEEATIALFDAVAAEPGLPGIVLLPMLSLDTEFAAALLSVRKPLYVHAGHQRAVAKADLDGEAYLKSAIKSSRAKKLRQQFRTFAKMGELSFHTARSPSQIADALDAFLELEARGWKGRGGTSLDSDPGSHAMAVRVVSKLAGEGRVRIISLRLDEVMVAGIVVFLSAGHAWMWKIAYDETHARHSPGKHVFMEAVRIVLDEMPGAFIDSCAAPDHPLAELILGERVAMGDVVVSAGGTAGPAFRTANLFERLRGNARSLRNRFSGK